MFTITNYVFGKQFQILLILLFPVLFDFVLKKHVYFLKNEKKQSYFLWKNTKHPSKEVSNQWQESLSFLLPPNTTDDTSKNLNLMIMKHSKLKSIPEEYTESPIEESTSRVILDSKLLVAF